MRNEILAAIDNLNDVTFETQNSLTASIADYYEKYQTVLEYYEGDVTDIFMEGADLEAKKEPSTLTKIWESIKRFFRLLIMNIKYFVDRFMKLFESKSDNSKTTHVSCDSIVLKLLTRSKANVPDDQSSWTIPQINRNKVDKYDKKEMVTEAAQYVTVNIPSGKGSTFYPKTVKVPKNDIITEINNTEKTITFHIIGFSKFTSTTASGEQGAVNPDGVTGTKKAWLVSSRLALYLLSDPEAVKKLDELIDLMLEITFNGKKHDEKSFNKKCKKILDSLDSGAKHVKEDKVVVSMKDLTDFQKKMNQIGFKIDKYANTKTDVSELSKETINNMNDISIKFVRIQSSMNLLSSSLEKTLVVSEHFVGSIKSLALLDEFVATCVEQGVPPKFIAYNTWLVADKCIKGDKSGYEPVWGQSRFIFFPPNKKFVYKIAMNGLGITSNRAEIRTSEMFVKMDRVDLIAPIVKSFERDAIVVMERVDSKTEPSYAAVLAYTKHVNDAIADYQKLHKIKLNIKMSDQHKDNVKYDSVNKCYRSIDYGVATRAYAKK